MRIAILSPSNDSYSETFIQSHRRLKGEVFFFYDGEIPKKVEGKEALHKVFDIIIRIYFRCLQYFLNTELLFDKYCLKRNLRKYKIEIGLAEYGTTGAKSYQVFKSLDIPLVVHFHGFDASVKSVIHKYEFLYKEMFAYASHVIAVSTDMRAKLLELGAVETQILVNPYGPGEVFLEISNKPLMPYIFLSVGRFTDKKSPLNTIKAFALLSKKFSEAELWMVGDGHLLNKAIEFVKELHIESKVKFFGKRSPGEIAKYLEVSYAFVLHSITPTNGDMEGTPVSILEAMAAGVPVVSTKHGGIKDVIQHGINGYLVEEHNIQRMAEYMQKLIDEPDLRDQFGVANRNKILADYRIDRYLHSIDQILAKSLNSS